MHLWWHVTLALILSKFKKYGSEWSFCTPAQLELQCIRKGGQWKDEKGNICGLGLFYHHKQLQVILDPEKKWHRWNELLLKTFIEKRFIGVAGPASSGKSREASDFVRSCYYAYPDETTVIMTSTERERLEERIWAYIKAGHKIARQIEPSLPGQLLESSQRLLTDERGDSEDGRDFRNGIVGVPCKKGGNFVGMGAFAGIKNKYVFLVADEGSFLPPIFVDAISNLNKNLNFKCIVLANPKDKTDAHGRICEPRSVEGGWDGVDESEVTKTWKTRFPDGICVQLVGTDCPNFDVPEDAPVPYPFLITRKAIADDIAFYGRDSAQFAMMNMGMWPKDSSSRRVITRSLCVKNNAFEPVTWKGTKLIDIFGVDAAFGGVGGDRCVGVHIKFGLDIRDVQTVAMEGEPVLIKVNQKLGPPEDQIVEGTRNECAIRNIPPENVFFDNSGRGSLVTAFHRLWSTNVGGIDFGGKASERLIAGSNEKTCREYFEKFVSELWFSVRHLVEGGQFRQMLEEVMVEFSMREWTLTKAGRVEIEPKWKTKERMGRSPDIADAVAVAVEGARQRGLKIARFATKETTRQSIKWLEEMRERNRKFRHDGVLA